MAIVGTAQGFSARRHPFGRSDLQPQPTKSELGCTARFPKRGHVVWDLR
jgi:hypothetical protein